MAYGTAGPFGLQPRKLISGEPWCGGYDEYPLASGYATALFTGDPVTHLVDGTIGRGAVGGAWLGVFFGVKYTATDGTFEHRPNWVASTTVLTGTTPLALVITDPNVVWSIQEDNGSGAAGTALALTDRFVNANVAFGTTGSTATGLSGMTLDNTTLATTATLNLKVLALDPDPRQSAVGNFANWLVVINNHLFKGGTGTAGLTT